MKNKKIKLSLVISAFTISLIFSNWVRAEQAITRVELWDKLTLTLEGPQTNENATPNPFTDYRLDAIFTSPSNKQYRVPGFYAADGNAAHTHATSGNLWQILFSPNELGNWKLAL